MDRPRVVSRDEWLAARKELLVREKQATRVKDAVDTHRRALSPARADSCPGSRFLQRRRHHRPSACSGGLPGLKIGVRF
jgi:hypothetical protein